MNSFGVAEPKISNSNKKAVLRILPLGVLNTLPNKQNGSDKDEEVGFVTPSQAPRPFVQQ